MVYIGQILGVLSLLFYLNRFLNKESFKKMKFFILFLFSMSFVEFFALIFRYNDISNILIYNILTLLEFNFLFLFYREFVKNKMINPIIVLFNIVYFITSFYKGIDLFITQFNTIAPVSGAFLISIVLILYLREILMSEDIINYKKNIVFWITTALLFYYMGTLPLTAVLSFLVTKSNFASFYKIQHTLTIVMHSTFIFGLLWNWKKVK